MRWLAFLIRFKQALAKSWGSSRKHMKQSNWRQTHCLDGVIEIQSFLASRIQDLVRLGGNNYQHGALAYRKA
jgi:hypothetical protein